MIRFAAAVAVTVCVSPAWLGAQTTVLTVNTASADVYKSPSTGSPIIGHTPRGTVLAVTRELGSWVKVSWPGAQDEGYVHLSMGSLGRGFPSEPSQSAGLPSARPAPEPASSLTPMVRGGRPAAGEPLAPVRPVFVTPATHLIGLGGRVGGSTRGGGSTFGFGAIARAWSHDKFGAQLEISHYALTSVEAPGRVTSIQFEPSVLYRLPDHVANYLWVRPYLGSGVNLRRQTLSTTTPGAGPSMSENQFGLQAFGGGELTFPSVAQFALSVDLGYHWVRTSFAGVDLGGPGVSVSGHWYVK
jgi:SH3 domain-containing protein